MSEPIQLLVVGCGSIGERHVRCFQATGRVKVAICEVNAALRERITAQYAPTAAFDDYRRALDSRPQAVVIATPAHLHIPMAQAAVEQGLSVLIEKPLSVSLEGIDTLTRTAEARRVPVAVAYVYRAHPALAAMRAAINSGRFGRPVQIVATCGQHFPHYRPAYRDIYYRDRATGGGAVQDALTHIMDAGQWLVGPIDRLVADLDHKVLADVTVEDTVHVLTRQGTVMGSYSLNQHQAPNEATITVICERGTARFEHHHLRWRWQTEPETPWHDEHIGPLERDSLFIRQADMFLDLFHGEAAGMCTLSEGVQTLRVNLAILASAEGRTWQMLVGNR